jgi:hypothetical protein
MSRIIILKYFITSLFVFSNLLTGLSAIGYTATFNVINEDELREALSTAASNGEDDTNIGAGIYRTSVNRSYTTTQEEMACLYYSRRGKGHNNTRW